MSARRAIIVGCQGQDGVYLSEYLEASNYEVVGIDSGGKTTSLALNVDIRNRASVRELLSDTKPHEVYYLAAYHQSAEGVVPDPGELVERSFHVNTLALNHFLHGILTTNAKARLFYAASSRVFGNPDTQEQDERTPFHPVCPYGISKAAGVYLCRYYRREFGVYCSTGILYNHESPRRSAKFLSRKVVKAAVAIKMGRQAQLVLGNLDALVDWGYAPDYVRAMWAVLRPDQAGDFVIASGKLHSVREFVEVAFSTLGLEWKDYVTEDGRVLSPGRPQGILSGNAEKLRRVTGWLPQVSFCQMIRIMVEAELEANQCTAVASRTREPVT